MDGLEPRPWNPARRCTATARSGERCRRQPIPGGEVCVLHGGDAQQVQQAAKRRLLAMVEPVLGAFEEVLATWHRTTCPACNHPAGDPSHVIRVGQLVLDRSGFHPSLNVIAAPQPNPFADMSEDELVETLEAMLTEARVMKDARDRVSRLVIEADSIELPETLWSNPLGDAAIVSEPSESSKDSSDV